MVKDFEMMILSWWAPNAVTSDLLRGNQGDLTQREEKALGRWSRERFEYASNEAWNDAAAGQRVPAATRS